jgi:GAF domain-containing protein
MNKSEEELNNYVTKVRQNTQQYIQALLSENANLRTLVGSMEKEKELLREQAQALREELEREKNQQGYLKRRLADVEASSGHLFEQYLEVEQQNNNLANLYVSAYRLHATLDRREVLDIMQEIIINLIGSEELAIFEMNKDGSGLSLLASFGIDSEQYRTIPAGCGLIGRTAISGEPYMRLQANDENQGSDEDKLTACVPLKLKGRVTGVIAIFQLLQQKKGFEQIDHELLNLLAEQSSMALYCTELHAEFGIHCEVMA